MNNRCGDFMKKKQFTLIDFEKLCIKYFDFLHEKYNFRVIELVGSDHTGYGIVYSNEIIKISVNYEVREQDILVSISKKRTSEEIEILRKNQNVVEFNKMLSNKGIDVEFPLIGSDIGVDIEKLLRDNGFSFKFSRRPFFFRGPLEDYLHGILSQYATALSTHLSPILCGDLSMFYKSMSC